VSADFQDAAPRVKILLHERGSSVTDNRQATIGLGYGGAM
jgi:hypothetical protein